MNDKTQSAPIRVLVVDDSALVRRLLEEILNADPEITVVGTARDPYDAREKTKRLSPDVLTLDVEMPRMDGLTFLSNLMRLRPTPVLMISSLTERGADVTLTALELGAIDFVAKPRLDVSQGLTDLAEEIVTKVKVAARSNFSRARVRQLPGDSAAAERVKQLATQGRSDFLRTTDRVVAIGASTGGTEAIRAILSNLPADAPGIVVTQHIPEAFSKPFANRLNEVTALRVQEAAPGAAVRPGHVYIAPGHLHLKVRKDGARYVCETDAGAPVNRHRPSVDVMFDSVSKHVGPNALGILLTGMGADGAEGLLQLRKTGAMTVAQDQATSVVWGMPGAAIKLGAACRVKPLEAISAEIVAWASREKTDVATNEVA
ncbi:MAG: chemotaxis response regulator protein-glutamate methylesterase [Myxococcales bacterium]|nr:chemotaxis response regulator protein-glutamate methylesterase [Myxococcales bacterium]